MKSFSLIYRLNLNSLTLRCCEAWNWGFIYLPWLILKWDFFGLILFNKMPRRLNVGSNHLWDFQSNGNSIPLNLIISICFFRFFRWKIIHYRFPDNAYSVINAIKQVLNKNRFFFALCGNIWQSHHVSLSDSLHHLWQDFFNLFK